MGPIEQPGSAMRSRKPDAPARDDLRCDLQMHSDWSDGGQTLEEIVETGRRRWPPARDLAIDIHVRNNE